MHNSNLSPVVVVLQLPPANILDRLALPGLGLVAHNLNLVGIGTDELVQKSADDRGHARGDDNGGDVVLERPLEVVVETGVEPDVVLEVLDALGEGLGHGVHLRLEGISAGWY